MATAGAGIMHDVARGCAKMQCRHCRRRWYPGEASEQDCAQLTQYVARRQRLADGALPARTEASGWLQWDVWPSAEDRRAVVLAGAPLLAVVRTATPDPARGMSPHQKRAQRRHLQQQRAAQLRRRQV
eukprot:COSAG01_NODE_3322_length_6257_cov_9.805294_4_plen_128_part_00